MRSASVIEDDEVLGSYDHGTTYGATDGMSQLLERFSEVARTLPDRSNGAPTFRVTVHGDEAPTLDAISEITSQVVRLSQVVGIATASSASHIVSALVSSFASGATHASAEMISAIAGLVAQASLRPLRPNEFEIEIDASPQHIHTQPKFAPDSVSTEQGSEERAIAVHARLASDLREMSGMSASQLGAALGVTREQYSRWTSGRPISMDRHGQLQYLHTLIRDLTRRLGSESARVWLRTPGVDGRTPVDIVMSRRFELLHRLIADLPDHSPVVSGTVVALLAPTVDAVDDEDDYEDEPWSPYASDGGS
ncbi:helix-turn-helix domain-containing protein [Catellatospora aurea]|uniref:Helix-turn-helix domain-containing protein n=1 Tax=Catellatospora aurea TaxID=1337874 RepID=A0ABW2H2B0_9ACTN